MEIPKVIAKWRAQEIDLQTDRSARWLLLFGAHEDEKLREELEGVAMNDPILQKTMEQWEESSRDPVKKWEYEYRKKALADEISGREWAREEGKLEGKLEGKEESKAEFAKKLLRDGVDFEQIRKWTEMSMEELRKLKAELGI